MENYEKLKEIGKGSYGIVWLVKNRKDKKSYVLKQIDLRKASTKDVQSANQEAKLLSKLKHPNIVSYKDSFETNGYLYIVMLFCEGGDLYSKIKEHNKKNEYIKETQVVEWFVQIAMAIQYMHERHILHRDLKTQNIFLTKNKIIKVGDLGIARVLNGNNDMATTIIGTPYYMSPELFSNKPYNSKSDIWALGCCVFEMATLKHAFNAKDMNSLVYKILSGKMPTVPNVYSRELINLIMSMLNADPKQRPSVNKILREPYIRQNIYLFLERTKQRQKDPISVDASNEIMKPSEAIQNRESNQNLKHRYSSPNFVTPSPLAASPIINSDQKQQQRRDSFSNDRLNDENNSNDKVRKSNPNLKISNENGHISKSPSEPSFLVQQKNNKSHSRNSSASSFQGRGDGNSDSESEYKKPVPQKSSSPPQNVPISKKPDQQPKPRRSVRISSVVSDIENEEHIQINDSSPRESYDNRKKSPSNNSSGSSSVESVENNKIIVPKVNQPPKIISKPTNSNTPPIISVLNSDLGANRNSADPAASSDNVAKNESARERRRLKLRLSAQADKSIEAKPPVLKKIEKPGSRPQSGNSESRPRSSGSKPSRVAELSEDYKKQLPFKDSLKLIRDRNAIVSKSDDLNNKPKHSKSLSDLQQQNRIIANKSVPIINDDSSSSSSEEPENIEEKKLKQEKKDKKEVDEFINLLNTTLRMNANKPDSEIDEFDDYEEDFIEEVVDESKNKKPNKDDDEEYEELNNYKNMTIGTLDATKRMHDRISLLERDCIDGLGKKMFDQACQILENFRDEEIEPRLVELLGKRNFDEYAGKIWQFKFYKESENLSRR